MTLILKENKELDEECESTPGCIPRMITLIDQKDKTDLFLHFAHQQLLLSLLILLQHFLTLKQRYLWLGWVSRAFFESHIVSKDTF